MPLVAKSMILHWRESYPLLLRLHLKLTLSKVAKVHVILQLKFTALNQPAKGQQSF